MQIDRLEKSEFIKELESLVSESSRMFEEIKTNSEKLSKESLNYEIVLRHYRSGTEYLRAVRDISNGIKGEKMI